MCLPIPCILIIPQNRIANILTSPCALRRAAFTNKQSCMLPKLPSFRLRPRFVKSFCQYVVNEGMLLIICPQRGIWSNRRKCKRSSPSYSPLHPRDGSFLFLAGSCPCWGSSRTFFSHEYESSPRDARQSARERSYGSTKLHLSRAKYAIKSERGYPR